jgi:hypothetical protein
MLISLMRRGARMQINRRAFRNQSTRENRLWAVLVRPQRETSALMRLLELDFRYHLVLHPIMTKPTQKGAKMKTRKIVLAIALSFGFLFFLGTCATTKPPLPTDNIDELLGAWVNPDYDGINWRVYPAVMQFRSDFTVVHYDMIGAGSGTGIRSIATFIVKKKWRDEKGAIYFRIVFDLGIGTFGRTQYVLIRISSDGKIQERMGLRQREEEYPTEIDPNPPAGLLTYGI